MHSAVEQDVEGSGDSCISAFRVRGLRLTLGLTTTQPVQEIKWMSLLRRTDLPHPLAH
jgi:hypothetical protein